MDRHKMNRWRFEHEKLMRHEKALGTEITSWEDFKKHKQEEK